MTAIKQWSTKTPQVIESISIAGLVDLILNRHGSSSTLVCCCTKQAFMNDLVASITEDAEPEPIATTTNCTSGEPIELDADPIQHATRHHLLIPTLHLLSSSRTLKVVFCPEVTHLLAYLAKLSTSGTTPTTTEDPKPRLLAILNPVTQHKETGAFSAQGLGRFFSSAAHTARILGAKLVIAECPSLEADDEDEDLFANLASPSFDWDEQVGMLNVTTKTYGAGDPGWQGRTVSLRQIASRWCTFAPAE